MLRKHDGLQRRAMEKGIGDQLRIPAAEANGSAARRTRSATATQRPSALSGINNRMADAFFWSASRRAA